MAAKETVLPQNSHIGSRYSVTIPSWISLAKSKDSDPVVFYRVCVGIQSPDGIITTRTLLRRFNDFLKLHDVLKRSFPKKNIPLPPSKGFLRLKTKGMLEERRISLEEWIAKLFSDVELSRSMAMASFLELEAAARLSFQEVGNRRSDSHVSVNTLNFSTLALPHLTASVAGSSFVPSENGSDTAYETSDIGSPSLGRDNISEIGTEDLSFYDDINHPIDEGLSMGQGVLMKIEDFPKHKVDNIILNGSCISSEHAEEMLEFPKELNGEKNDPVFRKISNESIGSEKSSQTGSPLPYFSLPNSNGPAPLVTGSEVVKATRGDSDYKPSGGMRMVLPVDQRQIMNRILTTVQRRLVNAKTDMEDLTSRLNQEIAVKDYLASKVKDLEVELETMKRKSKENLEHAMFIERERMTQMQWELEELRQKSMEMELKLKSEQMQILEGQLMDTSGQQIDLLNQQLESARQNYAKLLKRHQEREGKFKSDIRVLVKEVKSLRGTHAELKEQLSQLVKEKSEAEERLQEEREGHSEWRKLQECNLTSSHRNNLLPLGMDTLDSVHASGAVAEQSSLAHGESRETLHHILAENAMRRKQVNSISVDQGGGGDGDVESHSHVNENHGSEF